MCDIAKMYFRIGLLPEDKPYHRFLWRGTYQNRTPDVYEFDRVVFGVNSSTFQAQFVLQQHAKKYKDSFPMATETLVKSKYMDDSMDSVHTEEQGIEYIIKFLIFCLKLECMLGNGFQTRLAY